ncbi:condensation domain-containing protein, partial [Mucilaginibacter sp. RCC_168]|uniref:condensation domain-containing protein n=1 Tax=Mucilaginibacter sp. RCC_168 TaxID=3239221 RepID=UPI003525B98A
SDIEDIYPLSPMQEGMLFHHLYDRSSVAYFLQTSYQIHGTLDISFVQRSLVELSRRHDVLRTAFVFSEASRSLQAVLKSREIEFAYHDFRVFGWAEMGDRVRSFKEADRLRSFDLSRDVLMRVHVLHLSDDVYEFIWSYHHILMDGWCLGTLTREYYEIYNSYIENRSYHLPVVRQYKHYIQWLSLQDESAAASYWSAYLSSYSGLSSVPALPSGSRNKGDYFLNKTGFSLGVALTRQVVSYARSRRVTLNTVIETVWGILLSRYNHTQDVVFGSVVSGRPGNLDGVEDIIGLFINTVPVRICYEAGTTFSSLVKGVQHDSLDGARYHYYPLAKIQSSVTGQPLLDHIMVFENYPDMQPPAEPAGADEVENPGPEVVSVDIFEHNNYSFTVIVMPGEDISIRLDYDGRMYDRSFIERIPGHFLTILDEALKNDIPVSRLSLLSASEREELLSSFSHGAVTEYGDEDT